MNTIIKTILTLSATLMLLSHAQASENTTTGTSSSSEPDVVGKVEHAVKRGAEATVDGVKRGGKAAAKGLKRGGEATEHGIDVGVKATKRTTHRVVNKLDKKTDESPATDK